MLAAKLADEKETQKVNKRAKHLSCSIDGFYMNQSLKQVETNKVSVFFFNCNPSWLKQYFSILTRKHLLYET